MKNIGPAGTALIQSFENCKLRAYPDPATGGDPWTIGWGTTGPDIKPGVAWTQAQCDARFLSDLQRFVNAVNKLVGSAATTQNQFDALVSFTYNEGADNLRKSTLLAKHLIGDSAGAQAEFAHWNKARVNGKLAVVNGLTRRRAAEAKLYGTA